MRVVPAWILAAVCSAGCGARSEIFGSAGVGASSSTSMDVSAASGPGAGGSSSTSSGAGGSSSTSSGAGGSSSSSSSGAGGGPCTWAFGDVTTIETGDFTADAVDDAGRIVVTYGTSKHPLLEVLHEDLTPIDQPFDLDKGAPVGAAFGFGRRMLIGGGGSSAGECAVQDLDADAHPVGPPVTFDSGWCYWGTATPTGSLVFAPQKKHAFTPVSAVVLDAAANVVSTTPDAIPLGSEYAIGLARAVLDDGSVIVIWLDGDTVYGRTVSPVGELLTPVFPLFDASYATRAAATSLGSTTLVVTWLGPDYDDIRAAALATDGTVGANHVITPSPLAESTGFDVVRTPHGPLVVYGGLGPAFTTPLVAQPVDESGAPNGPSITQMFDGIAVQMVRAVPTAAGAVVLLHADPDTTYAVRIDCLP